MPKAMNRMLPIPLATSVLWRRRITTSATHATYANAEAARNQSATVSFNVVPVSTSSASAAKDAPMPVLPLLPM